MKLGQLTETQEALYEENEWLAHELDAIHAALEEEKTHNQEAVGKMKKVSSELKRKRVELVGRSGLVSVGTSPIWSMG